MKIENGQYSDWVGACVVPQSTSQKPNPCLAGSTEAQNWKNAGVLYSAWLLMGHLIQRFCRKNQPFATPFAPEYVPPDTELSITIPNLGPMSADWQGQVAGFTLNPGIAKRSVSYNDGTLVITWPRANRNIEKEINAYA